MREILFKGKRIDNGEWVEGYLFKIWERAYILWGTTNDVPNMIEVDANTICQYTGLTDKNGNKVFIGDVVRCSRGCPHEVIWLHEYAGTYVGGMPAIYLSNLNQGYAWVGTEEVIGNVFDNAELVKG